MPNKKTNTSKNKGFFGKLKHLITEGNSRKIIIQKEQKESIVELTLTIGIIVALMSPGMTAIGIIVALIAGFSIKVENR
ncbi:MAG: hypothetical protein COU27_01705 [Candidatus Levybacteria bacterium CG10_big_fil_rev_8_21_14_0_10_36_7]|nr:MAG: hypothetical protein COU27_01705 [Candidatus Levybacteria bacterium CG10_big_fil_rev_8_21_14_0_10_36_7]